MSYNNDISSLSYTNKDFNSIYSELLDYAKKLSYKWDPSASDESDPGIVLLKLLALIGDKNNYNIDTNILELMPASVTQTPAARQLFSQCGYHMAHYQAAQGTIQVDWKVIASNNSENTNSKNSGTPSEAIHTAILPRFTMFTDTDASVVYTSIEDATLRYKESAPVDVMEGQVVTYEINGSSNITLDHLDSYNRLYFTDYNVAENGIFITNTGRSNYEEWTIVDNLELQPPKSRVYKFGVALHSNICYIEFPEDIDLCFEDGITVKYIQTSGRTGSISAYRINSFLQKVTCEYFISSNKQEKPLELVPEHFAIYNPLPITNGSDPESINEAYKNYERVKGTFDTLISLRDYCNYLVSSKTASNGYICDRTNDIQHSYVVREVDTLGYTDKIHVEEKKDPQTKKIAPILSAFDLTVYALEYVENVRSDNDFKRTFTLETESRFDKVVQDVKSLQHEFKSFCPNRILMIKNRYPINATIIPKHKVSTAEAYQMMDNIRQALWTAINSKQLTFGEGASYDTIYTTVSNADARIKAVSIDYPKYETYAVFGVSNHVDDSVREIREIQIDTLSDSPDIQGYSIVTAKDLTTKGEFMQGKEYYELDTAKNYVKTNDTSPQNNKIYYIAGRNYLYDLYNSFRAEIFAKNVLCGATSMYEYDDEFIYGANQKNLTEIQNVKTITPQLAIETAERQKSVNITLDKNEALLFEAPSYIEESNYSSYVKVVHNLGDVDAETLYELKDKDKFIAFFYKASSTDSEYTYVKYDADPRSLATHIKSSFPLYQHIDMVDTYGYRESDLHSTIKELPSGKGKVSDTSVVEGKSLNEVIANRNNSDLNKLEIIEGTRKISTHKINKIQINSPTNGCFKIYWIINSTDTDVVFPWVGNKGSTEYSYVLRNGEYFLYTDAEQRALHVLGEGTLLTCDEDFSKYIGITCKSITYQDVLLKGIQSVSWKNIGSEPLYATEQEQHLLGEGITVTFTSTNENNYVTFNGAKAVKLSDTAISYLDYTGASTSLTQGVTWTMTPILALNCGPETPQQLKNRTNSDGNVTLTHSVELADEPESISISPRYDTEAKTLVPVYILCNVELASASNSTLFAKNILNNSGVAVKSLDILKYEHRSSKDSINFDLNGTVSMNFTSGATSATIDLDVLQGTYLLEFNIPDEGKSRGDISLNVELLGGNTDKYTLTQVNNSSFLYEFSYLKETENPATITVEPVISGSAEAAKCNVLLLPLLRLSTDRASSRRYWDDDVYMPLNKDAVNENEPEVVDAEEPESFKDYVWYTLSKLDPESVGVYTSTTTQSIIDPLDPEAFLKSSHCFNQFTISEWTENTDKGEITILMTVR